MRGRVLKLVLITPMPPCAWGAGAIPRLLHAQLEALQERHEVTLVTVAGPGEDELEAVQELRNGGVDVRPVMRSRHTARDRWGMRVRLVYAWGVRRYPWRSAWYWEPGVTSALANRLAEGFVDVVHMEDNATAVYRFGDVPAVLTEHEVRRPRPPSLLGDEPVARRILREWDWRRWQRYQTRVWQGFDRLQVFTARDAARVAEIAPALAPIVRVNPFSVEIPPPCPPARECPGELLFMGNFSHPPNVDAARWLVHDILPAIRSLRPSATLVLVGDQMPERIRALAGEGVQVIGRVPDTRPWLERAQVVLAPVRIGGGMRMKVLDAMANGKAVVSTRRGVEGMEGAPVPVGDDAASIARHTAALLGDDAARRVLGRRARAYAVARHSPAAHLARLETVYGEAIDAHRDRLATRGRPSGEAERVGSGRRDR